MQAEVSYGRRDALDHRVHVGVDLPFVEQCHRQDAVGVLRCALRLVLVAPSEHGVCVEQHHVDARVVHLPDETVRRELQVAQVGWVEVLGIGLTSVVPQDTPRRLVDAKVHVRQVVQVGLVRVEDVGRAFKAITQAKRGLVVACLRLLHPAEVLPAGSVSAWTVGGLETVCVRVDNHAL